MPRAHACFAVLVLAAAALIAGALPASADTIVLKGNRLVLGTYHGGGADEIRMTADENSPAYARKDVITLVIGTGKTRSRIEPLIAEKDLLELTDETVVEGRYAGGTSEELRFEVDGEIRSYPLSQARRLTIGHPDLTAKTGDQGKPDTDTP